MKLKKYMRVLIHIVANITILLRLGKRLYKWIKPRLSWGVRTKSPEEIPNEFYRIRRERFLAEALIYFVGSAYVMEGSQERVSSINFFGKSISLYSSFVGNVAVAIFLLLVAFLLLYLSFNDRPLRLAEIVESYTSSWRAVPFLVFTVEWIKSLGALANKGITTWFVTPYSVTGLLLILLIVAQTAVEICRHRRRKRATRKN